MYLAENKIEVMENDIIKDNIIKKFDSFNNGYEFYPISKEELADFIIDELVELLNDYDYSFNKINDILLNVSSNIYYYLYYKYELNKKEIKKEQKKNLDKERNKKKSIKNHINKLIELLDEKEAYLYLDILEKLNDDSEIEKVMKKEAKIYIIVITKKDLEESLSLLIHKKQQRLYKKSIHKKSLLIVRRFIENLENKYTSCLK